MRSEIRYAIRGLLRDRVFALMIVLSLAVGIGANTAIFSLVNGVLLQPPDFPHPERLVALTQWAPKLLKSYPALPVNIGIYTQWRKQMTSFESAGIVRDGVFNLTGSGQPEQVRGARVSAAIFQVLGVQPSLGRAFTEEEEKSGHDQVAILADALWRRRYQADPGILGRKILLDGKPYEIIGVLPGNFNFPRLGKLGQQYAGDGLEIYKPLGYEPDELKLYMGDFNYWTTARLRPGVMPAKAQAELNVVQAAISKQIPGDLDLHASLAPLQERMVGDVRQGLVLLFALAISLLTGLIFGALPALRTLRSAPVEALKSGGRGNTDGRGGLQVRNVLVTLEVGLSAALLVTAGLLIASFVRLMNVDKGFQVDRVLAMNLSLLSTKYPNPPERTAFFQRVLEKAAAMPGVRNASIVSALPLMGETWIDIASLEHDTRPLVELPATNVRFISPGYFQTLTVGLRDGRDFEEQDRTRKVTIISASLAQRLWGRENPVGRRMTSNDTVVEVVGVTPDFRSTNLDKEPVNMLYIPYWQRPRLSASLLVRTSMDPRGIASALRSAVWAIDSEVTVPEVRTLEEVLSTSVAQRRFQMLLVVLFALAALALAAFGTYGVLSYAVTRRTAEMGIRMALGAQRSDVLGMVLRQGMTPVLAGLAAGALSAVALGRYLESLLFQVSPRDPLAFAVSGTVLLLVSIAACLIPARRATRVSPTEALRFE